MVRVAGAHGVVVTCLTPQAWCLHCTWDWELVPDLVLAFARNSFWGTSLCLEAHVAAWVS